MLKGVNSVKKLAKLFCKVFCVLCACFVLLIACVGIMGNDSDTESSSTELKTEEVET